MATINVKDAANTTVAIEKPNANGRAAAASSRPVAISTEDLAALGSLTETAPANDTASSGLNGRLQRIAQRLTSLIALLPSSLGAKTGANSLSVVPASDAIATTGGLARIASSTITRPANTTAYSIGDLVANNVTAGSVTPFTLAAARINDGSLILRRIRLRKSTATLTNAQFRVHLFSASPTVSVGDNAAFNSSGTLSTTGSANYLGYVDISIDTAFSDGANGFTTNGFTDIQIKLASGSTNIFALLEARSAYTPGNAETITITLEVLQD